MFSSSIVGAALDCCSIELTLVVFIAIFVRKTVRGTTNRLFILLCLVNLFVAIADLICDVYAMKYVSVPNEQNIVFFWTTVYYLFNVNILYAYFLFLCSYFRLNYLFKKVWFWIVTGWPTLAAMLFDLTNSYHHLLFTINADGTYVRGDYIGIQYAAAILYGLMGLIVLFRSLKITKPSKWIPLFAIYLLCGVATLLQYLYPAAMIEYYLVTLCLVAISMFVLKPEDLVDPDTGLPTYQAFYEEMQKIYLSKQNIQVIFGHIENANFLRQKLGEEEYRNSVKRFYGFIDRFLRKRGAQGEVFYSEPGQFACLINNGSFSVQNAGNDMREEILHQKIDADEEDTDGVYLFRAVALRVPEEAKSIEDLSNLNEYYPMFMKSGDTFGYAQDIVSLEQYDVISHMNKILLDALDEHRFEMFFQPIYDVKKGKFVAAEALVRLEDPTYGRISPSLFIPVAVKKNLMLPIGDYIPEETFAFLSRHDLKEEGLEKLEIKLSVQQCLDTRLTDEVLHLEEKCHVDPKNVAFEITESVYDENDAVLKHNLEFLSEHGYSFALDDYGTGYSNLQRILRMPLSVVKIDKSMAKGSKTEKGRILLENTVHTLKEVNKKIAIEGVEDASTRDEMVRIGADFLQGYFFAHPLKEEAFFEYLKRNNDGKAEEK